MIRRTTGLTWKVYAVQFGLPGTNKIVSVEYRKRLDDFHDRALSLSLLDRT